jgi:hypothetical protein
LFAWCSPFLDGVTDSRKSIPERQIVGKYWKIHGSLSFPVVASL